MIDNEICQAAVSYFTPIAEMFLMGYCFCCLVKPFMENKKGAFCAGLVYSLTMLMFYIIPLPLNGFMAYSIGVSAAFFVMCRADRRNYGQKVFLTVTFFSLRWFASAVAEISYDNLYNFAENTNYMAEHLDMWFALYVGMCLFYLVAEVFFAVVGTTCILKAYAYPHANMAKKELFMLTIPSFMGVVGYEIMQYYRSFYILETGSNTDVYDMLALLYYVVSVLTMIVVIALYQSIRAKQEEKLQNELLAAQIDSIRQHIGQVDNLYQNIRSIKHDMTNHILTLERLYAQNKTEEAKAYSTDLQNTLAGMTGGIKSGNPVTDVILQELEKEAEKKKICFHSDFHYPADSVVNAFDVSVILNNALQNAVENAGGSDTPYISILSYRRNNAYMIEISNSFGGELQWDIESGLPATSKGEKEGHGYGLSNIRRVAGKYAGDIDIEVKDGEFRLIIMLMLEE